VEFKIYLPPNSGKSQDVFIEMPAEKTVHRIIMDWIFIFMPIKSIKPAVSAPFTN
jgi:hypothetical protein